MEQAVAAEKAQGEEVAQGLQAALQSLETDATELRQQLALVRFYVVVLARCEPSPPSRGSFYEACL